MTRWHRDVRHGQARNDAAPTRGALRTGCRAGRRRQDGRHGLPGLIGPALITLLAGLALAGPAAAQQQALTIDAIYHPDRRVDFNGDAPIGLTWIDDAHYLQRERASGRTNLLSVDAATGDAEPFLDAAALERALAELPGMSGAAARRAARSPRFVWNADH